MAGQTILTDWQAEFRVESQSARGTLIFSGVHGGIEKAVEKAKSILPADAIIDSLEAS